MGIADAGDAHLAELTEGARELEDDAGVRPGAVMEAVNRGDVEEVFDREPFVLGPHQAVARDVAALFAATRAEYTRRGIVLSVVDELHEFERMRGAAHTKIDLDGRPAPRAIGVSERHKVDGGAPNNALRDEHAADLHGVCLDGEAVLGIGRKPAPEVGLAVGSENLIVR